MLLNSKLKKELLTDLKQKNWMSGDLNPGPLPCEGSVIPLHHTPEDTGLTFLLIYNTISIQYFNQVLTFLELH